MPRDDVLYRILSTHRRGLEPEAFGLPPRPAGRRGRKVQGLTQSEIDLLTSGRPTGHYGRVESGRMRPTQEYLLDLAHAVKLPENTYTFLHLHLYGSEPPAPLDPDRALAVPAPWQRALDGQTEMAYVNDRRYNLVAHNKAFAAMFPSGAPPKNTMEWMLLDDEARDFCLADWDRAWGPLVVPQFRAALAAHPDDPVLRRIEARVLKDKRVKTLYEHPERVYIHPDGDRRPLHHATRGRGFATMIVAQPLSSPGARYMTVLFDPE